MRGRIYWEGGEGSGISTSIRGEEALVFARGKKTNARIKEQWHRVAHRWGGGRSGKKYPPQAHVGPQTPGRDRGGAIPDRGSPSPYVYRLVPGWGATREPLLVTATRPAYWCSGVKEIKFQIPPPVIILDPSDWSFLSDVFIWRFSKYWVCFLISLGRSL